MYDEGDQIVYLNLGTIQQFLEPELSEEEFESGVLGLGVVVQVKTLVLLFKVSLQELSQGVSGVWLGQRILLLVLLVAESLELSNDLLNTEFGVNIVSGWHHVSDVDVLNERLDLDSSGDSLLRHVLVDLSWASVDTSDEHIRVLSSGSDCFVNSENDCLSASISTAK